MHSTEELQQFLISVESHLPAILAETQPTLSLSQKGTLSLSMLTLYHNLARPLPMTIKWHIDGHEEKLSEQKTVPNVILLTQNSHQKNEPLKVGT